MKNTAVFHPRIETDIREAMTHYAAGSPSLGERFKRTFYAAVDRVLIFPEKHAVKIDTAIRTTLMRPFPYLIFFVLEGDAIYFSRCNMREDGPHFCGRWRGRDVPTNRPIIDDCAL